jgi:capsid protein
MMTLATLAAPLTRTASAFKAGARSLLGFDAVKSTHRRKAPSGVLRSEDQELTPSERAKLLSGSRDIARNFSIAGWAIRKHLDYVSTFHFQPKCKDKKLNARLLQFVTWWSKPENFDVAGRHSLRRSMRMLERARTVDGDQLVVKMANGKVQFLEGDRVRTPYGGFPDGTPVTSVEHGVQCNWDEAGKALRYAVCRRGRSNDFSTNSGSFFFERWVPAQNAWLHGYFDRVDQIRGIALLGPTINVFRDVYESCDYALAKMKVAQLFGLALYRDKEDKIGKTSPDDEDEDKFVVDFGKGPQFFDLDKDDKLEFHESATPSDQFQGFAKTSIAMSLKAFDIPFSFYDESFTNFSGQRQAWIQYDLSAYDKRDDNRILLDDLLRWRLAMAIADGYFDDWPGITVDDLLFIWMNAGIPWINPLQEVQADTQAVASAFTSRQRVCRSAGDDFFAIADEIKEENDYLLSLGLPTTVTPGNVQITEVTGHAA